MSKEIKIQAASKALRVHFSALTKLIDPQDVAVQLYSKEILDSATMDKIISSQSRDVEKAYSLLLKISDVVKTDPNVFEILCSILESEGSTKDLSLKMKGDYAKYLESEDFKQLEARKVNRGAKCQNCSPLQETFLDKLRLKLRTLNETTCKADGEMDIHDSVVKILKVALEQFIVQSQQSSSSLEHVNQHLRILHEEECLITDPTLYQWALQLTSQKYKMLEGCSVSLSLPTEVSSSTEASLHPAEIEKPLLFSKSVVWHASICSHAVSICNAGDYQSFFKNKELVRGHTFNQVSISRSKEDRILIATQEDSTFYFAFQSELAIAQWPKRFKSFQEGIETQGKMVPVNFIVKLLNTGGCRIVLTGFSFGGLLASYVAMQVWGSPYITSRHLLENSVCITFAQPHIPVPGLAEVARERPEMLNTMHHIYYQEDLIPRLVKYLNKPCSTLVKSDSEPGVQLKVKTPQKMAFDDPLTQLLFHCIEESQPVTEKPKSSSSGSTEILKENLKRLSSTQIIGNGNEDPPGIVYSLACLDPSSGLQFNKLTTEQVHILASFFLKQEVENISVAKHSMLLYCQKVFMGYLQKSPEYVIPPLPKVPKSLDIVKPIITSLELHEHGNEMALVLEGKNLWFSSCIVVSGESIETPAKEIGGTSIKFNIKKEKSKLKLSERNVSVTIHSHFLKPSTYQVNVHTREYHVTKRQQQLARLSPSQLIQLAYLSALLEQHPHSTFQPVSYKVLVIHHFLENVVQVVPFESIAYAIAYGNNHVATQCSQALYLLDIPKSRLMKDGLYECNQRLFTGLSPEVVSPLVSKLRRESGLVGAYSTVHYARSAEGFSIGLERGKSEDIVAIRSYDWKDLGVPESALSVPDDFLAYISKSQREMTDIDSVQQKFLPVICELDIGCFYPISDTTKENSLVLKSPLKILQSGKNQLHELAGFLTTVNNRSHASDKLSIAQASTSTNNSLMLQKVNSIRETEIALCTSLLGAFMEQQEIDIPLMKSKKDRSNVLKISAKASVGVWALSSLNLSDLQDILKTSHGQQLIVKIESYIKGIVSSKAMTPSLTDDQYAAKLQFIVQGVRKTVTCNSQYISYSLERQLVELCDERNITVSFPLDRLTEQWDLLFEKNILSLVAKSHRPLLARWLKWALMVNQLREELAKYTAVGVIGLVNSGKSRLVNSLFRIEIPSGTTEGKRTTVPFMYNLEKAVEGLDVVDFPGVDDRDETISDLADLLLTLAQIVVFVVDYRKIHTESGKKWLERLQVEKVPVLVCLTFADKLYAEHMTEDGKDPDKKFMKHIVKHQLSMTTEKLHLPSSFQIKFFSFSQDRDSVLNCKEGRQKLREVGIGTHLEVGDWLVETFKKRFGQDDLAERLHDFIHSVDD